MDRAKHKAVRRVRRHGGIRKRITGTPSTPRLAVYRSLKHIYAQVIDDLAGRTLASASTREAATAAPKASNPTGAGAGGNRAGQPAQGAGVAAVPFARGGGWKH